MSDETKKKVERYDVLSVRKGTVKGEERNFWDRCGVAFVNKDGSINVKLHNVPLSGEVQLRKPEPKTSHEVEGEA